MAISTVNVDFSAILQDAATATGLLRVRLSQVGTVEDGETGNEVILPITWQETTLTDGAATLALVPNKIIEPSCTYYEIQLKSVPDCPKACAKLLLSGIMYVPDEDCNVLDLLISPPSPETANTASGYASQAKQAAQVAENFAIQAGERYDDVAEAAATALTDIGTAKQDALDAISTAQNGATEAISTAQGTAIGAVQAEGNTQVGRVEDVGEDAVADVTAAQATAVSAVQEEGNSKISVMEGLLQDSQDAKDAAELAQSKAEDAQEAAEDAQQAAETAQGAAEAAQDAAETAEDTAEQYIRSVSLSYQGAVATVGALPSGGADESEFYYVQADGKHYIFKDGAWEELASYAWIINADEKPEDTAELNALYNRLFDGGILLFGQDDNINPQYPYTLAQRVWYTPGENGEETTVKAALDMAIKGIAIDGRTITVTRWDGTSFGLVTQDTTYGNATQSSAGLMSAADKVKLDGIQDNANKYVHPGYQARNMGLYKIQVDNLGHVDAVNDVQKSDITALGIPGQDTTYSNASASSAGLMSAADKVKLDGIEAGANANVYAAYATVSSASEAESVDMSSLTDGGIMIVTINE